MLSNLSRYLEPILEACLIFPAVAALFTLPFMVINYRKYGGIALMRVLVVYSFILYCMCAYLLTVLPLPTREAVAAMAPRGIGWMPFSDWTEGLKNAGILGAGPGAWLSLKRWAAFFRSADFFQIAANIVMQVPLGFYLRYYFRRNWKQTVLIGLCVSLFYELTQLRGLYFIYPQAYRYASVDDVMHNTLGAALGYALTPLLNRLLPSRAEIDRISYRKGEHLTLIRRSLAAVLDIAALLGLQMALGTRYWYATLPLLFLAYFAALPRLTAGRTPGQVLLKLRVVRGEGKGRPTFRQLTVRNVLLYIVEPFMALCAMSALMTLVIVLMTGEWESLLTLFLTAGSVAVLLTVVWIFLASQKKWNAFPHGHYSHTVVVQTGRIRPNLRKKEKEMKKRGRA